MMAKATNNTGNPLAAVLAMPRADVVTVQRREAPVPRRKKLGEVFSTADAPSPRKMLRAADDERMERTLGSLLFSALAQIRAAYLAAFGSGGVARCVSLEARVDGSPRAGGATDRSGAWSDFARRLTPEQAAAIVAVAVRGETFREAERTCQRRNGWAALHVRAACECWFGPSPTLRRKRLRLRAWRD